MIAHVDTSAFIELVVAEPGVAVCDLVMTADRDMLCAASDLGLATVDANG